MAPQFKYECQEASFRLAIKRALRCRGVAVPAGIVSDTQALVDLHGPVSEAVIANARQQDERNAAKYAARKVPA